MAEQSNEQPPTPTIQVEVKPGWKTTEFWVQVAAQIIAFMVAIGVLASDKADAVMKVIGAVVAVIASIGGAVSYGINRTNLKGLE